MVQNLTAIIQQDEDGIYVGKILELRGCLTQGRTKKELLENLKDAAKLCLEVKNDLDLNKFIGTEKIII